MKLIIGIVSYVPGKQPARKQRIERLKRLIQQCQDLWPDIEMYIYAQNWTDKLETNVKKIHNHIHCKRIKDKVGILAARKALRKWLLSTSADQFMLFDDDAIIQTENNSHIELLKIIEQNPQGWTFQLADEPHSLNPFADSQLNLCVLSRYIFEQEDFPNFDPEKSEAFEDRLFSMEIYCKYPTLRYDLPNGIKCIHFKNPNEKAPSTWAKEKEYKWNFMRENTKLLEERLFYKYLPPKITKH